MPDRACRAVSAETLPRARDNSIGCDQRATACLQWTTKCQPPLTNRGHPTPPQGLSVFPLGERLPLVGPVDSSRPTRVSVHDVVTLGEAFSLGRTEDYRECSVSSFSAKEDNTESDDTMAKPRMDPSAIVGEFLEEQSGVLREGLGGSRRTKRSWRPSCGRRRSHERGKPSFQHLTRPRLLPRETRSPERRVSWAGSDQSWA